MIKSWSTSQNVLALSSGEAELYAMTKMAVQIKGMMALAADFNILLKGTVYSDSNAAIGIVHKDGLSGRCRHIKVQYLWIQKAVREKEMKIDKVAGASNPAGIFTKAVSEELLWKHMKAVGYQC